jgi:hypothetical protein
MTPFTSGSVTHNTNDRPGTGMEILRQIRTTKPEIRITDEGANDETNHSSFGFDSGFWFRISGFFGAVVVVVAGSVAAVAGAGSGPTTGA